LRQTTLAVASAVVLAVPGLTLEQAPSSMAQLVIPQAFTTSDLVPNNPFKSIEISEQGKKKKRQCRVLICYMYKAHGRVMCCLSPLSNHKLPGWTVSRIVCSVDDQERTNACPTRF